MLGFVVVVVRGITIIFESKSFWLVFAVELVPYVVDEFHYFADSYVDPGRRVLRCRMWRMFLWRSREVRDG